MNKFGKLMLGAVTVIAPLLFVLFGVAQFRYIGHGIDMHVYASSTLFWIVMFCTFICYGLGVFYIIHSRRSRCIPAERRGFWLGILLIFNVFAYPIYWYRFIWNQETE